VIWGIRPRLVLMHELRGTASHTRRIGSSNLGDCDFACAFRRHQGDPHPNIGGSSTLVFPKAASPITRRFHLCRRRQSLLNGLAAHRHSIRTIRCDLRTSSARTAPDGPAIVTSCSTVSHMDDSAAGYCCALAVFYQFEFFRWQVVRVRSSPARSSSLLGLPNLRAQTAAYQAMAVRGVQFIQIFEGVTIRKARFARGLDPRPPLASRLKEAAS